MEGRVLWLKCGSAAAVLIMAPTLALAYIDPGNGAYMVQALFTVVAAGIFYLRHPIRSAKAFGAWLVSKIKQEPVATYEGNSEHITAKAGVEDMSLK